jgi:hypothetical protein
LAWLSICWKANFSVFVMSKLVFSCQTFFVKS